MEVTLLQMLEAREERAARQVRMNRTFGKPLVSFSMNIAGPVKDSPLIRRGFEAGCDILEDSLPAGTVLRIEKKYAETGCEAMYAVDLDPRQIKAITAKIEDTHGLGRLFDMDVLDEMLCKLDRDLVGGDERRCLVCGAVGRGCASRRVHPVAQLQKVTGEMLTRYFREKDACSIGDRAVDSLLEEVNTTPKPGLVDLRNNGSHRDMNVNTFYASAEALRPYFRRCAQIGQETASDSTDETFRCLRAAGLDAEQAMYAATKGVNTHKGAIFTIGILCGAAGRLWKAEEGWDLNAVLQEVSAMTKGTMESDFRRGGDTVGHRLYQSCGIRGIRGEVASGLPSVSGIGLPAFRAAMDHCYDRNLAGVTALLHLIARVEDTNMISRGGIQGAKAGAEKAALLLNKEITLAEVEALDDWFIQRNLSPGGCADLLAAVYFLDKLTSAEQIPDQKTAACTGV